MNKQEYWIGFEDLDGMISKAYSDGEDAVRLALLSLRDVAIERMMKALKSENEGKRQAYPTKENPGEIISASGEKVQYWFSEVSECLEDSHDCSTGPIHKLPAPGRAESLGDNAHEKEKEWVLKIMNACEFGVDKWSKNKSIYDAFQKLIDTVDLLCSSEEYEIPKCMHCGYPLIEGDCLECDMPQF